MFQSNRGRLAVLVGAAAVISIGVALVGLWAMGAFLNAEPQSNNTPEEIFRTIILDPIPPGVRDLEAGGDTWQGYRLWARFAADADTYTALTADYHPTSCDEVRAAMADQSKAASWRPQEVASPSCYRKEQVSNSWTTFGTHYLLIDEATGVVYFFGIGS